ncbi:ImmA/IrrE family metallo-endopeptidase [Longimicrobium sp.]|jgi:hypothetical protein|uniref:ImmA/IrrE family metallo-endopeptidase n=1 Tax=Longimicrobium sp. TaxID=2029185 RepID=UPI0039C9D9ED
MNRRTLAERALRVALETRVRLGIPLGEALSVYDAADRLGLEVRFLAAPSLEGMYVRQGPDQAKPLVIVSALRPAGRQASTAAHEIGHHAFGHGTRIDQYIEGVSSAAQSPPDPDEILANAFGAFFLMPKAAVERGFRSRGFDLNSPAATEAYQVAGWLGVGYGTLVQHMRWSLNLLSKPRADALLAHKPKRVREDLLGVPLVGDVMVVDRNWTNRPVDLQVGDQMILPIGTRVDGLALSSPVQGRRNDLVVEAIAPGIAQVLGTDWAVFARVARRGYEGRGVYRHLDAADGDVPIF